MSLGDLAAIVNTSRSFLSQVEQGKTLPSLGTLKAIAAALTVTVGSLIDEPQDVDAGPVVRAGERSKIDQLQPGIAIEALTHKDIHKIMQPMILKLEPNATSGHERYVHKGQEFAHVLSGQVDLEIEGAVHHLEVGDSIYFDSSRPHRFMNPTSQETHVLWVVTPPTF
jgi:transcriptional regulator with XRE-family HTH domain